MSRSLPALLVMTAAAAVPVAQTWAGPASTALAASSHKTTSHKPKSHKQSHKATSHSYAGQLIQFQYGAIQAKITVKGKKLTNVVINASPDSARGQFIDSQADPILRQETLKAKSANISIVSGATQTSEAYIQSLQTALKKAHI